MVCWGERSESWRKIKHWRGRDTQRRWSGGIGGVGGEGMVFVFGDKRGSVMSRIMRPGHPSTTCILEMRDLVSSLKPLGVSWLRKGKKGGRPKEGGGGVCLSQNSFTFLLHHPPPPAPRPIWTLRAGVVLTAGLFLFIASSYYWQLSSLHTVRVDPQVLSVKSHR